jgi:hypothetical protein
MARPERNNVDYFPFYCSEGKKMYYLEETYGNDGFAVFVKILRELAKTDFHYLDLSKNTTIMFLSAKCKVDIKILESIIDDLVKLEKFDSVLWNENKIIWCQDFIDSIQDAYIKRKNKCITYEGLFHLLHSLGVRKLSKCTLKGDGNPQTKEKEIKEKKSKQYPDYFNKDLINVYIEFLQFRKERKASITKTQEPRFFKKLENLSNANPETAKEILIRSIENGWQGIFELNNKSKSKNKVQIDQSDFSTEDEGWK